LKASLPHMASELPNATLIRQDDQQCISKVKTKAPFPRNHQIVPDAHGLNIDPVTMIGDAAQVIVASARTTVLDVLEMFDTGLINARGQTVPQNKKQPELHEDGRTIWDRSELVTVLGRAHVVSLPQIKPVICRVKLKI
jgi:hypothetical protein